MTFFVSRSKLLLFLRQLGKVRFFSPSRYRFVIFEKVGADYLMPLLAGERTFVLHFPPETIHITPSIVCNTFRYLLRGFNPITSYLRALITQIDPEIVLTFIDNSARFGNLAYSDYSARRYLAIQNGARYDLLENDARENFFFHSEFACFGKNEEILHRQAHNTVIKFYFVGSLREAYYRRYQKEKKRSILPQKKQYDICVVGEASPGWDEKYPGMELGIGRIAQFAVRLAEEYDLKIVIAGKRDVNPSEVRVASHSAGVESQWYQHYISDKVEVTPRIKNEYSTYRLISDSSISIGCVSTALYEGASRGSRVLFCNFTGHSIWDFPGGGINALSVNCEDEMYEKFRERVLMILEMEEDRYRDTVKKSIGLIIKSSYQPDAITKLENIIFSNNEVV